MKKNLLALAVAGAFVAPVAMADTGNVTVYGTADVSYDQVKNGDTTAGVSGVTNNKISSNVSHLGFKGSEDLGSGLKAIWQIESLIALDNAGGTFGTRNSFAGLAGDSWGSLTLGRNDTPYKTSTRGYDVFMDHIADNRTLMGGGSVGSYTSFDNRFGDTVRYNSPDLSGFKIAASYTASSETNTTSNANIKGRAESLSGNYATGPFSAALAYEKHTFGQFAENVAAAAAGRTDEKAWKLGGGYKVDQFGVNAVYEKTTDSLGSGAGGRGHKSYYLAGVFNATANDAIKLAYTKAKDLQDGTATNTGAKQWAIGVDHSLSKRTTVYAMYTKLDNDSAATYALSSAGVATGTVANPGAGADPSAFSLGLKHTF